MILHKNYTVIGRVQGVFFRASTREAAERIGIYGRVSNQPDGSVFVEAEGTREQLDQLRVWLEKGPPMCRVDKIKEESRTLMNYSEFRITY